MPKVLFGSTATVSEVDALERQVAQMREELRG
jgi:polyhydroxyalkanoate synthesis regulator phasin